AGTIFVQFPTLWLVRLLGGGDPARGWQLTMVLYGVLASMMFVVCFLTTRERVKPPETQRDLRGDLGAMLQNKPLRLLFLLCTLVLAGGVMKGATTIYYLQYFVQTEGVVFLGMDFSNTETLATFFLTGAGVTTLAGVLLTQPLNRFISKERLYLLTMGLGALLTIAFYFLPGDALMAIFALNLVTGFVMGPTAPLMFAMFADVADYGEWQTGRSTTGLVFSGVMLFIKFGAAMGGYFSGLILGAYGYVPNVAQSETSLQGILLLVSVIPGVLMLIGASTMFIYPLTDTRMSELEQDLAARRAASAEIA
ncbi:MAG: MFS transporter, partial [Myxococcota bacterium]